MSENTQEQNTLKDNSVEEVSPDTSSSSQKDSSLNEKNKKQMTSSQTTRRNIKAPQKKRGFQKGGRPREERPKPEFEQKIINISRVTRVVKGGRRLSFRVDIIIGDKKGRVGLGSGKATDTSLAIQKAVTRAKKNLVRLGLTKNNSLPHASKAKVTSSYIEMTPNKGRGLVAGSTVRTALQLGGVTDVTTRVHSRSKNKLNNAKATMKALEVFVVPHKETQEKNETNATKKINQTLS